MRELHEEVLEVAHFLQLVDSLNQVLRRAHKERPGLQEVSVQLDAGGENLVRVGEDLPDAKGVVEDESGHAAHLGFPADPATVVKAANRMPETSPARRPLLLRR